MISHSSALAAALLFGACAKPDPSTSTITSTQTPAASTITASATGAATQPPTVAAAAPADDDHAGYMKRGMPSGMSMQHPHDGGMNNPMLDHPMPPHQ